MNTIEVTTTRLDEQILWYDTKSTWNQKRFKYLKIIELLLAGSVPVLAGLGIYNAVVAVAGALVVFIEAIVQLNQYQHNWLVYRSTCEELKHEKYLYAAVAGAYATAKNPTKLLAERVEGLISKEHAKWVSSQEEENKTKKGES